DLLVEEPFEIAAQLLDVATALADDVGAARVVEDREQQVLERQVFVTPAANVIDRTLDRRLKLGGKHASALYVTRASRPVLGAPAISGRRYISASEHGCQLFWIDRGEHCQASCSGQRTCHASASARCFRTGPGATGCRRRAEQPRPRADIVTR